MNKQADHAPAIPFSPEKKIRLTPSEIANAATSYLTINGKETRYTIIRRPQEDGRYWIAAVDVDSGRVYWNQYAESREDVRRVIQDVNHWMDKMARGGPMSDSSRHRMQGSREAGIADRVAKAYIAGPKVIEMGGLPISTTEQGDRRTYELRRLVEDVFTSLRYPNGRVGWMIGPAKRSPAAAMAALKPLEEAYLRGDPMGSMVTREAMIKWTDHDLWSGIAETNWSPS